MRIYLIFRDISICREFETMLSLIKTQGNYNGVRPPIPARHIVLGQEAAAVVRLIFWD